MDKKTGGAVGLTAEETEEPRCKQTPSDPLTFLSEICGRLKTLKRTGWVRHNVPLPESDSDHMHRCAMCSLLLTQPISKQVEKDDYASENPQSPFLKFHPKNVDQTKLLKMTLTHDLCESLAGDITPFCSKELVLSKHDKECESMKKIQNIIGDPLGKELFDLWKEYEEQETVEAIYCKDIDKFEMVMQAFEYEKAHLKEKDRKRKVAAITENGKNLSSALDGNIKQKILTEPMRTFFQTTTKSIKTPLFRKLDRELRERRKNWLKENGWNMTKEEYQV